jgi:hypothetical protein
MSRPRVVAPPGTGRVELLYNPYQQAFLAALRLRIGPNALRRAYSRLALFAGRRAGKTLIGGLATVTEAGAREGQTIWVCSGSYPKLHDYVIPAVNRYLPKAWLAKPFSASHYEWTLKNETIIQARSLDEVNRGRGPGLDVLWIDEARDVNQLAWKTLVPALVDKRGVAIITTTPSGFDWCHDAFWAPAADLVPGYWACKYKSVENPFLEMEEIEAARRDMDPLFFLQEFEAEFVSFTGAIYGDVLNKQLLETDDSVKRLIAEWPKVDPSRSVVVGIDPGADHPFAAVVLVSTEKGLVAVGEYLSRDSAIIKHAQGLFAMLHRNGITSANTWAIDRSQKQTAIELGQHGIFVVGAENDVVSGIQRVKSWLFSGRLFIFRPRCPKLVQQLFSYRWAENVDGTGQSRRERVIKTNDDLPDALRYAVMTWPELPYPDEPLPVRSLEHVPVEHKWALERNQRADHPEVFEHEYDEELDTPALSGDDDANPVGDFWN